MGRRAPPPVRLAWFRAVEHDVDPTLLRFAARACHELVGVFDLNDAFACPRPRQAAFHGKVAERQRRGPAGCLDLKSFEWCNRAAWKRKLKIDTTTSKKKAA